jgi:(1->4)-alpha-D-glucan 1-alpha-D-glucosylmutase
MNGLSACVEELARHMARRLASPLRWPGATYRLQFHPEHLTFRGAARIVPYLHKLGVTHVYASPCLKARSGSPHGYDTVDPSRLNPELGSDGDYGAFVQTLHAHGMGQVLDFVPNHMGIVAAENPWWNDVLENGPSSPYARYFDIDWRPVKAELQDKILLPLLGDQYGEVLESGQLQLDHDGGAFFLRYFDRRLPLDPRTYSAIFDSELEELKTALGAESEALRELESIRTALEYLPERSEVAPERVAERQREKEVIKGRIRRLGESSPEIAAWIARSVRAFNGTSGVPGSFDRLDQLLGAQVYRLSHWKAAADEVNYRRFFDINELAAVSTEVPEVFDALHGFLFELLVRGDVDGLRIDHVDGLYDPLSYLHRLQEGYLLALGRAEYQRWREERPVALPGPGAPEAGAGLPAWEDVAPELLRRMAADGPASRRLPLYVVVEKILGPEEPLPEDWPVAGTTGYDFLNLADRLFVDPSGLPELLRTYQRFINQRMIFREVAYEAKRLILRVAMFSELQLLAHRLNRISERHRRSRDFTLNSLRVALREVLACFPVYRTYIRPDSVSERDRQFVHRAVAQAKRRNPARDPAVFDFLRDVLLQAAPPGLDEAGRHERELFLGRFQQVTSPLVAKGIEDTAFYVYFPLASLNEVGSDPAHGPVATAEFHRDNSERHARRPGSLLASTTHDTKRSEDVRARINVLAEVPPLWRAAVNRWARLNRRHRREVDGLPAPSRSDEFLFYQTLVGVWPIEPPGRQEYADLLARIQGYMEKAIHEAKQRTSWINPNTEYDAAVRDFSARALEDRPKNRFLSDFRAFHERILDWGLYGALSQVVLKLTSPGVPDIYQGQELWDFSLVDPDIRRPVDFARRHEILAELQAEMGASSDARLALARRLARHPRDPRLKLFVTWQALQFRRQHADWFRRGEYVPLAAEGPKAEHVCAFAWRMTARPGQSEAMALVVVPRLVARLTIGASGEDQRVAAPVGPGVWADTHVALGSLPRLPMTNALTGEECLPGVAGVPLAAALAEFPVAILSTAPPTR